MNMVWNWMGRRWGTAARAGLLVGATVIVLVTVAVGYWLLRTDYQVLFADLGPQDAAAMTAELDRLKIPYALGGQSEGIGGEGATILVDKNDVYRTRIKLMGKDIPLHGAVGFELFNNSDLGMTEFAQKINYQRALQGEITRTILGLKEIRDARVLLVLPEQSLFKQAGTKPKASITLTMKAAQSLRAEQVAGIQRLVSAAVPGIQTQDVTIVDHDGVALTRAGADAVGETEGYGAARLDLKRDTETYLARKATAVLEQALGAGQASASVDVTLNMDRIQSSTDEPLTMGPAKAGAAPTGIVAREKSAVRESGGSGLQSATSAAASGSVTESNQREVEYALGHRVEHVVSQPGSVRRIQTAVVILKPLTPVQQESLKQMVAAAVGASFDRGDTVVIQTSAAFEPANDRTNSPTRPDRVATRRELDPPALGGSAARRTALRSSLPVSDPGWPTMALALAAISAAALGFLAWMLSGLRAPSSPTGPRALSGPEREEVLKRVRHWMAEPSSLPLAANGPPVLDAAERTR